VSSVVSDTSPLNYLILIGEIDLLPKLFNQILIPPAVHEELQDRRTPPEVFAWAAVLPSWAKVQEVSKIDPGIGLGRGEVQAISLALELGVPAILIDDRKGWLAAEQRGLVPVGTLALLDSADRRGLVDFALAVSKLKKTNFHINPDLIELLLTESRMRRKPP
jgi:predicted nucleic acid-binding protein